MNSSHNQGISFSVDHRNWRFVVSAETFNDDWFPGNSAVDVIYHFNPKSKRLAVHFANFMSQMVLAPAGLRGLATGLGGRVVDESIQIRDLENQEGAQIFAEFIQDFFEDNRALSRKSLRSA